MNKLKLFLLASCLLYAFSSCQTQVEEATKTYQAENFHPAEDLGAVFHEVQMKQIFSDSKTFADCVPLQPPDAIKERYQQQKQGTNFNLEDFVHKYFNIPATPTTNYESKGRSIEQHLPQHWEYLTRSADTSASPGSLLPLPHPYVVPGGRFREIYYWDSYFTMLGLYASDRADLAKHMIDNFTHLIDTYGFIPNGNRTYYLSRSQPPFFSLMVMLLAEHQGMQAALPYLSSMQREYEFWMQGSDSIHEVGDAFKKVVMVGPNKVLNRYWDAFDKPRTESYREDLELAENMPKAERPMLFQNLRSACESGWDFSSRWLTDPTDLGSIITTEIIPVDLNS
ncbi:MAG: trehalase family glycosidase, partial [Cyclobacteriaceae bacterium]